MKLAKLNDDRFHIAFTKLAAQIVPLKTAFKLKGVAARIQEEVRKFEEVRQLALKQYGSKDENGELIVDENGNVKFEKENLEAFARELNELGSTEVDIGTLSLEELGDKTSLTTDDLIALDRLIVE